MVLGVDIGGTKIRTALFNAGAPVRKFNRKLTTHLNIQDSLDEISACINEVWHPGVRGIGIGVPSIVDSSQGIVYNAYNIPSWDKVCLREYMELCFNIPAFINNDANCFVLGTHLFELKKQYNNVVGLTIGTGLGVGVITGRCLYEGSNCGAGEIGFLPYLEHDLEYYCSGKLFENEFHTTAEESFNKAIIGNHQAQNQWGIFGKHLAQVIKSILYVYDPECIIIGGSVAKAKFFFEKAMYEHLKSFHYSSSLEKLKITYSTDSLIFLKGAASLVFTQNSKL